MTSPSREAVLRLIVKLLLWITIGVAGMALGNAAASFGPPEAMAVGWGIAGSLLFLEECFAASNS